MGDWVRAVSTKVYGGKNLKMMEDLGDLDLWGQLEVLCLQENEVASVSPKSGTALTVLRALHRVIVDRGVN